MHKLNSNPELMAEGHLVQVIEPLASYICAADRPREMLLSALAALFREVGETNRAALEHFAGLRAESLGLAS